VTLARTLCSLAMTGVAAGCAQPALLADDLEGKPWETQRTLLPPPPKTGAKLLPFYVGPTDFSYFVEPASVSVGPDRVVRYTLIARSDSGATNVSYEGIRCESFERRVYAFGRSDGTWSQARYSQWARINRLGVEPQAALADDFFCRMTGGAVRTTEDALDVLARGNRR